MTVQVVWVALNKILSGKDVMHTTRCPGLFGIKVKVERASSG
jgi:hypothetical protein